MSAGDKYPMKTVFVGDDGEVTDINAPKQARVQTMPEGSEARKNVPIASGVLDYFPAALAEVAKLSKLGNDKHNPGQPLHWARGKSMDHADCIARHLIDRGIIDPDTKLSHTVEVAWRALALLQEECEQRGAPLARGARLPEETSPAVDVEIAPVYQVSANLQPPTKPAPKKWTGLIERCATQEGGKAIRIFGANPRKSDVTAYATNLGVKLSGAITPLLIERLVRVAEASLKRDEAATLVLCGDVGCSTCTPRWGDA